MITRDNTIGELKAMPEFAAFSDYIMVQSPEEAAALDRATIGEACGERAYIIVDAANWVLDEAAAGRVQPMDLWTAGQRKADPEKERTGLLFFPAKAQPAEGKRPYIIVCAGGAYVSVCNALEGFPAAQVLTQKGYHVFVLTYRVASAPLLPKPQEDLAQFVGDRGLMAKSRGEGGRPKDGSDVNFMYRKERLYRVEKETNAAVPEAAGKVDKGPCFAYNI